jgi:diadenosine tetraphosphatase ApaH/serine/threonine PP2A family protein phosphatase
VRVAALNDIHGNLPALEAVLAAIETEHVDRIMVGGDVLWGPFQSECLAALRGAGADFLSGNCERDVLGAVNDSSTWCRAQLTAEELDFVSGWPATVELDVDGLGSVVFCHATPRSDEEILTRTTPDAKVAVALSDVTADIVVCGHTHVQYDRQVPGGPRLVNAGSVGLPYEGEPGAFWALLGADVELRRTAYDVDAGLEALASSGFPDAADVFEESVRGTASAESATAYFESKRLAPIDRG